MCNVADVLLHFLVSDEFVFTGSFSLAESIAVIELAGVTAGRLSRDELYLVAAPPDRTPPVSPSAARRAAAEKDRMGALASLTNCVRIILSACEVSVDCCEDAA